MFHWLLSVLRVAIPHMPGILLGRFYSETEVYRLVSVIQVSGPADAYIVDGMNHWLKNVSLEIRNDLPFPIAIEAIEGRLQHYDSVFVRNLFLAIRQTVRGRGRILFSWEHDLPPNLGLETRAASILPMQVDGRMVITAIGKQFLEPVKILINAYLHRHRT